MDVFVCQYCTFLMMTITAIRLLGRTRIDIPDYADTSTPTTWYAHLDLRCMMAAHAYCTENYNNGGLLTLRTNQHVLDFYARGVLYGYNPWAGIYSVGNSTHPEYGWIPDGLYNESMNMLTGLKYNEGKRCFHLHVDHKAPHVHDKECDQLKEYVCEEPNIADDCGFFPLMNSAVSHSIVPDSAACRNLCQVEKNCWAFIYMSETCFILRNTKEKAHAEISMEQKDCTQVITVSVSPTVSTSAAPCTIPDEVMAYSDSSHGTVSDGVYNFTSMPLCQAQTRTETVQQTIVQESFITVPVTLLAINNQTTTVTVTRTAQVHNTAESREPCETQTHTATINQTIVQKEFVTVSGVVSPANPMVSTVTITETTSEYVSMIVTRFGETQYRTIEGSLEFATIVITETEYLISTEIIQITAPGGVITASVPCIHDSAENISFSSTGVQYNIEEMINSLAVSRNSTTRNKRKKISVMETRPSVLLMGSVSLASVGVALVLLLYNDIPRLLRDLRQSVPVQNRESRTSRKST